MDITLREYQESDEQAVLKLFDESYGENTLRQMFKSKKFNQAFLAFQKEELIGITVSWENDFHPESTYFRILVKPIDLPIEEIKKKLFYKLREEVSAKKPLITRVFETALSARDFYEKNGFQEIRRTFIPALALDEIEEPLSTLPIEGFELRTLEEIKKDEEQINLLAKIVKRNYEKTHLANPVKEMELSEWKKFVLEEDVLLSGSFVLFNDEKEMIAYSFLHRSKEKEDTYELGWCGVRKGEQKGLLPFIFIEQILFAMKHNIKYILGEFDTTDDYAMEILKSFSFKPFPAFITYRES